MRYLERALMAALGVAVICPPGRWVAGKIREALEGSEEASRPAYWGWDGATAEDLPLYPNEIVDEILERLA